jgi:hypothetical protein
METVSKGGYVHPGFRGSTSIKKVLPVIAPDLDYSSLSISEGSYASERWLACALGEVEPDAQAIVFQNLREYCHLDTLAMVRIWEFLRGISGTESCTNTDLAPATVV